MKNGKTHPARPHGARYPWDDWFDRGTFELRRGRDYTGLTHGMAQTVRQAAAARNLIVSVYQCPDRLTVVVRTNGDLQRRKRHAPYPTPGN